MPLRALNFVFTPAPRKIKAYLERKEGSRMPSASTITAILKRNEQIDPAESSKHRPFQRFEMEQPNQLWQMDFKGYFALEEGGYCHPLTVLDDHSRFLLGLRACPNEAMVTVKAQLSEIFRSYGLPDRMLMDNGSPWGDDADTHHTIFTAWLIRLGVQVSHGRPYHPQTQGKDERLHRTLQDVVNGGRAGVGGANHGLLQSYRPASAGHHTCFPTNYTGSSIKRLPPRL